MPDNLPVPVRLRPTIRPPRTLTAAATAYTAQEYRAGGVWHAQSWQAEAWAFYDSSGEFAESVDWRARAMSRMRLVAAEVMPEGPQVLEEGPAADLITSFCGGTPGHAKFFTAMTPLLDVPGEGWLIAERPDPAVPLAAADWCVYSTECVDVRGSTYWVQVGDSVWRPLAGSRLAGGGYQPGESLPMRIYRPHPRMPWLATSSAQAAVPILRRIELIDKRIIAMMVSRLAMNGLMLIPDEGTFGMPEEYGDGLDGFVAMLIDIASKNIANPSGASAGIPIPTTFTAELIEKWKILKPDDPLDEWLLKEREDELGRLGDALPVSRERVTGGVGEANHWSAWQISEEEVRLYFDPTAELICEALTKAYMHPALKVSGLPLTGPNGGLLVVWYDDSALAARTDLSAPALNLYDRGELSGVALRRESGFAEADAPDQAELTAWVWRKVLADPNLAPEAVKQLTGVAVAPPPTPVAGSTPTASPGPVNGPAEPATGIPPTRNTPPPEPAPPSQVAALRRGGVLVSTAAGGEPERNGHRR